MKKLFTISFIFLLLFSATGQTKTFKITGKITDCRNHKALTNVVIKIVCSDGRSIKVQPDKNGMYLMPVDPVKLPVACILICEPENNPTGPAQGFGYGVEKEKLTLSDTSALSITENFCLTNMGQLEELQLPAIYFTEKSVKLLNKKEEEKIKKMVQLMNDNPTFVIGVIAHVNSKEQVKEDVYAKRAAYTRNEMIKQGIKKERLVIQQSSTESSSAEQQSDYVTFSVISKDYIPK